MELAGKVAIVTGGAVRVGRALVLALAQQGVRVVVHYGASVRQAEELLASLGAAGQEALGVQADLRRSDAPRAIMAAALKHFEQVDILVNSAAIFEPGDVAHTSEASWDAHMAINLKAPFFLSQAFAAQMGAGRRGHIVNIVDWRGVRPGTQYMAYTLAKAALVAMTQSMALGLAPTVQVNAIAPGAVLPPPGEGEDYMQRLATKIPLQHAGSPQDVAEALLYLVRSDFVTGQVLFVTGGQHL